MPAAKRLAFLIQFDLLGACNRQVHDLTDLPPGGVVAWAELQAVGAAGVSRDDAVVVGRLYVLEEGVIGGHIPEGGRGGRDEGPTHSQHYYLGQLPAGGEV